jgi:hypothetical protein
MAKADNRSVTTLHTATSRGLGGPVDDWSAWVTLNFFAINHARDED